MMAPTLDALDGLREPWPAELAFLYSTPAYRRRLEHFGFEQIGVEPSAMTKRIEWSDRHAHLTDETMNLPISQGIYGETSDTLAEGYSGLCTGFPLPRLP